VLNWDFDRCFSVAKEEVLAPPMVSTAEVDDMRKKITNKGTTLFCRIVKVLQWNLKK